MKQTKCNSVALQSRMSELKHAYPKRKFIHFISNGLAQRIMKEEFEIENNVGFSWTDGIMPYHGEQFKVVMAKGYFSVSL
jgi:hypothetical protein